MRTLTMLVTAMLAGGCTLARMDGFDRLAAAAPVERIDVTGIPGWMNGRFRLGASTGTVRRVALGDAAGWGPAEAGSAIDAVRVGVAARFGTLAFDIAGPEAGGRIEARCRYAREERRDRIAGIDLAAPSRPLRLDCLYRLDGVEAGTLRLGAVAAASFADPRMGEVAVDGVVLAIRSTHRIAGLRGDSEQPIGYFLDAGAAPIAAIETNGVATRRLLLPRDPGQRRAALAALLTLALFWDPGNVD